MSQGVWRDDRYFVAEYRKMLVKNLDDYVENFDNYAPRAPGKQPVLKTYHGSCHCGTVD